MTNITRKAHTGEPTTNPGEFGSKPRTPAPENLLTPETDTVDSILNLAPSPRSNLMNTAQPQMPSPTLDRHQQLIQAARGLELAAVVKDIAATVTRLFPTATAIAVEQDRFGAWDFRSVIGEDDEQLTPAEGIYACDLPEAYELHRIITPPLKAVFGYGNRGNDPIIHGLVRDESIVPLKSVYGMLGVKIREAESAFAALGEV